MIGTGNDALYLQLMDSIKQKIISGEYKVGDRIMSERAMSLAYGINRLTVRKAIQKLEEQGCIKALQGKGTFVQKIPEIDHKIQLGTGENVSLSTTIKKGGMKSSRIVLDLHRIQAVDDIKDTFPDHEEVYQLIRLSLINDHPYAVQETYFPCALFEDAERFDFREGSLYDFMDMCGHCPEKVISYLQIVKAPIQYIDELQMEPNKCMFYFDYYGFDTEHKITEYTKSWHKSEYTSVKYVTVVESF